MRRWRRAPACGLASARGQTPLRCYSGVARAPKATPRKLPGRPLAGGPPEGNAGLPSGPSHTRRQPAFQTGTRRCECHARAASLVRTAPPRCFTAACAPVIPRSSPPPRARGMLGPCGSKTRGSCQAQVEAACQAAALHFGARGHRPQAGGIQFGWIERTCISPPYAGFGFLLALWFLRRCHRFFTSLSVLHEVNHERPQSNDDHSHGHSQTGLQRRLASQCWGHARHIRGLRPYPTWGLPGSSDSQSNPTPSPTSNPTQACPEALLQCGPTCSPSQHGATVERHPEHARSGGRLASEEVYCGVPC